LRSNDVKPFPLLVFPHFATLKTAQNSLVLISPGPQPATALKPTSNQSFAVHNQDELPYVAQVLFGDLQFKQPVADFGEFAILR
jgi:hypothetical protein